MKKKTIVLLAILIAVLCVGVSAGTAALVAKQYETKEEDTTPVMDEKSEELQALMKDENVTIPQIEEAFLKNFPEMEKETCTGFIDSLAYLVYYNIASGGALSEAEVGLISGALDADGNFSSDLLTDVSLQTKIQAFEENHACIVMRNGYCALNVDYGYFLDTYGEFMAEDYKAIFTFYRMEQQVDYLDAETKTFDLEVLLERIKYIQEQLEAYPESSLLPAFQASYEYYVQEYVGAYDAEFVVGSDNVLRDYIKTSYAGIVDNEEFGDLGTSIKKLLDAYEKNEWTKTSEVDAVIYEITGVEAK